MKLIWHKGLSFSYIRYELIEQKDTLIFKPYKRWSVSTNTGITNTRLTSDIFKLKIYIKKDRIQFFSNDIVQEFEKIDQKIAIIEEPYRIPIDLYYKPRKDYYFGQNITKKPSFQPSFFILKNIKNSPQ